MRAAVLHGIKDLRIDDVPAPEPREGEVLVRVAYCGVCGSDLGAIERYGVSDTPHPLTGAHGPQILGHEFSGVVTATGRDVTSIRVGDRVVAQPAYSCGTCALCQQGRINLCRSIAFHGLSADGGGLSEFTVLPAAQVIPIPPSTSLRDAALAEPLSVALHAIALSGLEGGEAVVVIGAGPIGIAVALILRSRGFLDVTVWELLPTRRLVAERLGLVCGEGPRGEATGREPHETSPDVVFDCAGAASSFCDGLDVLAGSGTMVVIAGHGDTSLSLDALILNEIVVRGSLAYTRANFDAALQLMRDVDLCFDGWVDTVELADLLPKLDVGLGPAKILVELNGNLDAA